METADADFDRRIERLEDTLRLLISWLRQELGEYAIEVLMVKLEARK